eukprot:CAMPEP_0114488786 /NCGR_PEP_ID=MMETSP0109-20121206/1519_1 /TAXON_ID=29199 /ORGANISM="Chlorarachnion reptans, Strain CCCM449" /LENGTH=245 /DNA_ID=CAMNT_0001665209 /DNA_START=342 /DNA_END=1079 /DNA_ORIENTATION=-
MAGVMSLLCSQNQIAQAVSETDERFELRIKKTKDVRSLMNEGMRKFREGDTKRSIACFDRVIKLSPPSKPFLWQRGIALYYDGDFEGSAEQFKNDVKVNPSDTEEAIWYTLCQMRLAGSSDERRQIACSTDDSLLPAGAAVRKDPRPVMRDALDMFQCKISPEDFLNRYDGEGSNYALPPYHDEFYSRFYAALWYEGLGEAGKAKEAMLKAVRSSYAVAPGGSEDFMVSVADVHASQRGYFVSQT